MGVNSLPETVARQRRGCDLNPTPSASESSTLTTRLPSHFINTGILELRSPWMIRTQAAGGMAAVCCVLTAAYYWSVGVASYTVIELKHFKFLVNFS